MAVFLGWPMGHYRSHSSVYTNLIQQDGRVFDRSVLKRSQNLRTSRRGSLIYVKVYKLEENVQ